MCSWLVCLPHLHWAVSRTGRVCFSTAQQAAVVITELCTRAGRYKAFLQVMRCQTTVWHEDTVWRLKLLLLLLLVDFLLQHTRTACVPYRAVLYLRPAVAARAAAALGSRFDFACTPYLRARRMNH